MNKSLVPVACVAFLACAVAHADVTIQDQTTSTSPCIKAHGTSTKRITRRQETHRVRFPV